VDCFEVSNRFDALEDFEDEIDMNSALDTVRENTKTSAEESLHYYEL
jgi:hypothetical protein